MAEDNYDLKTWNSETTAVEIKTGNGLEMTVDIQDAGGVFVVKTYWGPFYTREEAQAFVLAAITNEEDTADDQAPTDAAE